MFTVLGASGFVGSSLVSFFEQNGIPYFAPDRLYSFSKATPLGHVIYCIGVTADFRTRPFDTVAAHVSKVMDVLTNAQFESFLYLSSARVYSGSLSGREEEPVQVNASTFDDLYNISKLMGESVCLSVPNNAVRVARLSNVVGNDFTSNNFLFSLIKDAVNTHKIELGVPLNVSKDYVMIDDVVSMLCAIAQGGRFRSYNVASGAPVSNGELVNRIQQITQCQVAVTATSPGLKFPQISIDRIVDEFSFRPKNVLNYIEGLVNFYDNTSHDTN